MLQKEIYNNIFNKKANISIIHEEKQYELDTGDGRSIFLEDLQKYLVKNIQSRKFINEVSKLSLLKINKIINNYRDFGFKLESDEIIIEFNTSVRKYDSDRFELLFQAPNSPEILTTDKWVSSFDVPSWKNIIEFRYIGESRFAKNYKSFENVLNVAARCLAQFIKDYMIKAEVPTKKQSNEIEKTLKEIKKVLKQEFGFESSIIDEKFKRKIDKEHNYYRLELFKSEEDIKKYTKKIKLAEILWYIIIDYNLYNEQNKFEFSINTIYNDYGHYQFSSYFNNLEDLINQIKKSVKNIKERFNIK